MTSSPQRGAQAAAVTPRPPGRRGRRRAVTSATRSPSIQISRPSRQPGAIGLAGSDHLYPALPANVAARTILTQIEAAPGTDRDRARGGSVGIEDRLIGGDPLAGG